MEQCVKDKLINLKFNVNEKPYTEIEICNMWYANESIDGFHNRTTLSGEEYDIDRMNFAKTACEDDANLCEVIKINVGGETDDKGVNKISDEINDIYEKNNFDVMYRDQLEKMSATGTVGAYIYLDNAMYLSNGTVTGGDIRICYCYAENYIPLRVVNKEVIEAAFSGTDYVNGQKQTTLVIFTCDENGNYKANTFVFDKDGKQIADTWIQLGNVKPFEVMRVAKVNNLKHMDGFGYPKLIKAIPALKAIDLSMMIFFGDLDKGEKIMLTNELLVMLNPTDGKPKEPSKLMKKLFVFLGKDVPEAKSLIQEYNPILRVDDITKCLELALGLLSLMFGFGTKQYKFESGQIQTATQYIGERQDCMKELNKQRKQSNQYIDHLTRAIMWFSNQFKETAYDLNADITIGYDDSYIEDKSTKISEMRTDAMSFPEIEKFTIAFIMERFNLSEKEAKAIYENRTIEETPTV